MIQSVSVQYRYRHQPIRIDTTIMLYRYRWWWQLQKQRIFQTQNNSFHTWFSYNLTKNLSILSFILIMLNFLFVEKNRSLCFRTSIFRIHCIDQSKTFTLLMKSKIIDFETLSRVHVYRIEYASYRQGPYRIRIDTADDRIVPALETTRTRAFIFSI